MSQKGDGGCFDQDNRGARCTGGGGVSPFFFLSLPPSLPPPLLAHSGPRAARRGSGPRNADLVWLQLVRPCTIFVVVVVNCSIFFLIFLRMRFPSLKNSTRHDVRGNRQKANNKNSSNDKKGNKQTHLRSQSHAQPCRTDARWQRWKLATCYLFTSDAVPEEAIRGAVGSCRGRGKEDRKKRRETLSVWFFFYPSSPPTPCPAPHRESQFSPPHSTSISVFFRRHLSKLSRRRNRSSHDRSQYWRSFFTFCKGEIFFLPFLNMQQCTISPPSPSLPPNLPQLPGRTRERCSSSIVSLWALIVTWHLSSWQQVLGFSSTESRCQIPTGLWHFFCYLSLLFFLFFFFVF